MATYVALASSFQSAVFTCTVIFGIRKVGKEVQVSTSAEESTSSVKRRRTDLKQAGWGLGRG